MGDEKFGAFGMETERCPFSQCVPPKRREANQRPLRARARVLLRTIGNGCGWFATGTRARVLSGYHNIRNVPQLRITHARTGQQTSTHDKG